MRVETNRTRPTSRYLLRRWALVLAVVVGVAASAAVLLAQDADDPAPTSVVGGPSLFDTTIESPSGLDSIGAKRREQYAATLNKTATLETTDTATPRPGFPTDRPFNR